MSVLSEVFWFEVAVWGCVPNCWPIPLDFKEPLFADDGIPFE